MPRVARLRRGHGAPPRRAAGAHPGLAARDGSVIPAAGRPGGPPHPRASADDRPQDRPGGVPPFHVVVVSYRTPALLDRCLTSLAPEVEAGRATVAVVDNAPGDGSAALVREHHPAVGLVEPGANLGFGAAVDLGARGSRAAWICPANADVGLRPGALEALLHAGAADPGAGILAPRLLAPDGTTQHSVHPFPGLRFTAAFNAGLVQADGRLRRRFVLEGSWDPERPGRVPWAHGAFLAVRRAAWDAVGGFDPSMWMYAEDLDLAWRAARAGHPTRYVPDALVDHEIAAATGAAWGDERTRRALAATYRWQAARRSRRVAAAAAAMNVGGAAARAALDLAPGRAAHRGWTRDHLRGALDGLRLRG